MSPGVGQTHFLTPSVCRAHCHGAQTHGYHAAGVGAGSLSFPLLLGEKGMGTRAGAEAQRSAFANAL